MKELIKNLSMQEALKKAIAESAYSPGLTIPEQQAVALQRSVEPLEFDESD